MNINDIFEYLNVLAIPKDSDFTVNDIENHYRMLSKMYHPDMKKVKNSDQRFIQVKEARDFLVDNFEEIKSTLSKVTQEEDVDYSQNSKSNNVDTNQFIQNYKSRITKKTIITVIISGLLLFFVILPLAALIIMLIERA